jgi:hypothetical protein
MTAPELRAKLRLTPARCEWASRHVLMAELCGQADDPLRQFAADALADLEVLLREIRPFLEASHHG